jgi:hypothetical protein
VWRGHLIVPDESGTNDRMNPVFQRFRKLYINLRNPRNRRDFLPVIPRFVEKNPAKYSKTCIFKAFPQKSGEL